jgi:hypothetical protein
MHTLTKYGNNSLYFIDPNIQHNLSIKINTHFAHPITDQHAITFLRLSEITFSLSMRFSAKIISKSVNLYVLKLLL